MLFSMLSVATLAFMGLGVDARIKTFLGGATYSDTACNDNNYGDRINGSIMVNTRVSNGDCINLFYDPENVGSYMFSLQDYNDECVVGIYTDEECTDEAVTVYGGVDEGCFTNSGNLWFQGSDCK